ncbi:MAG: regulatory protein RecX [Firmicutes bacterium]|nr:regulatory protein RecX [Bacillota bacterium]
MYVSVCTQSPGQPLEFYEMQCDFPPLKTAAETAAGLLDIRAYTEEELRQKLQQKGFCREEAGETVAQFRERGYVDDEAYAKSLAAHLAGKGSGKRKLLQELQKRGIDRETAVQAAEEALQDSPGEMQRAQVMAAKLWDPAGHTKDGTLQRPDDRMKAKIARRLSSAGFESSVIFEVLSRLSGTEEN